MTSWNLAAVHEAIAEALPGEPCLVTAERRFTWAEITERTRRLASVLKAHGLGCHRSRAELRGFESGQDPVALYLYNGNEYLEAMLGAFKARAVPVNVNYRYVDDELVYLFRNAGARAVVYHASLAPTLARVRDRLDGLVLLLQVADDSGEPLLPGALDYERALAEASPEPPRDLSSDDLYVLYTGGTTGAPKGVLWRQEDILRGALYTSELASPEELLARATQRPGLSGLPAPPFMHGAAHWFAWNVWHVGGTVVLPRDPRRLDAADLWGTIERERVNSLSIVGDAFGRPLLDELRRREYDLSPLVLLSNGGAVLSAEIKRELLERIPGLRIMDNLGSSESGFQATRADAAGGASPAGDFELRGDSAVLRDDLAGLLQPGADESGWLARRGHVPLGYLGDPERTARTFPVVEGVRYAIPGDRARLRADGALQLLGRDSATVNTGGEKVFVEEVEEALKRHPAVYDAVVVGTPHERWGQQVTALVSLRAGMQGPEAEIRAAAGRALAAYKLPRAFVFVDEVARSPSGKADYRWARETALARLGAASRPADAPDDGS